MLPHIKRVVLGDAENAVAAMAKLAEEFISSSEKAFFESVIAKNIDRAKQLGLYKDDADALRKRDRAAIDNQAVQYISDALRQAVPLLKSDLTLVLASVFYEVMPPHQQAILAEALPGALDI